ncbi:MAG: DUF1294 domain-containing protein [Ruminococcaceae bacterium]|nr:DUF1294 domain-containing protein [Oscillospiraceae bacterium]
MKLFFLFLFIINAAAFFLMLIDKHRAQKNLWRIPERALLSVALLGGSFGVLLGMKLARHKTKKPKFALGVPIIFALQLLLAGFLFFSQRMI